MFLSLDGTLIMQIINFVVFGVLLNAVFLRPVGRALAARRAHIDAIAAEHDAVAAETRELRRQSESGRLAARREGEELLAKARSDASNEGAAIIARATTVAQEKMARAHATAAEELAAAESKEELLVNDLASTLLSRVIGSAR